MAGVEPNGTMRPELGASVAALPPLTDAAPLQGSRGDDVAKIGYRIDPRRRAAHVPSSQSRKRRRGRP